MYPVPHLALHGLGCPLARHGGGRRATQQCCPEAGAGGGRSILPWLVGAQELLDDTASAQMSPVSES